MTVQYLSEKDDHFHIVIILISQNMINESGARISAKDHTEYQ